MSSINHEIALASRVPYNILIEGVVIAFEQDACWAGSLRRHSWRSQTAVIYDAVVHRETDGPIIPSDALFTLPENPIMMPLLAAIATGLRSGGSPAVRLW